MPNYCLLFTVYCLLLPNALCPLPSAFFVNIMKAIMVVGTTSHAGKSLLVAALCRIFSRRGWRVTPFKGQNMALNSYVTAAGGEIGYAQAVQAWAAGVPPWVEMNPILLKPQGDMTSQLIVKGRAIANVRASQYYEQYFDLGWQVIRESLEFLSKDFDMIVCEGAGSPAEINPSRAAGSLTDNHIKIFAEKF